MTAQVPLEDVAIVVMGTSPKSDTYNQEGVGLPLLNGPTEFGPSYPDSTLFTTDSKRKCRAGDLIFCVRGSTTGRMNWADQTYSLGRGVCSIRGGTPLDTKYIRYCLEHKLRELLNLAGGGTFPNLTTGTIKGFPIPFPPSRYKVASILSAYDDLIENNARRIEILEEMAQKIYREWFVNFRFPGHEKIEMVESELGQIPSGWTIRKLEQVCENLASGGTPARKQPDYWGGHIGWFKTKELNDGFLFRSEELVTDEGLRRSSAKLFPADTVLMAIYAAPTVGRLGILTEPATFNQAACGLVADPQQLTTSFLYLKLYELRGYFNSLAQGAAQQNISVGKVRDSQIVLPTLDKIERFDVIASPLLSQIKTLSEKNNNLRTTRDLLLPKLISGEVSVENLDVAPEEDSEAEFVK